MADRPADEPDTPAGEPVAEAAATDPSEAGPAGNGAAKAGTAGATSIIAIGQTLDDPWRAILSIAGPTLMVVWRWLVAILQTAVHLWLLGLLAGRARDKAEREELQQKVQRARAAAMDTLTRMIGGGR